jgi:cbb3-type cytochrome oxidase subunit 3
VVACLCGGIGTVCLGASGVACSLLYVPFAILFTLWDLDGLFGGEWVTVLIVLCFLCYIVYLRGFGRSVWGEWGTVLIVLCSFCYIIYLMGFYIMFVLLSHVETF